VSNRNVEVFVNPMPSPINHLFSPEANTDAAIRVVHKLFKGFSGGAAMRLWNNHVIRLGKGAPTFTLVVRDPSLIVGFVTSRSPVKLADAYFSRRLDLEGDLYGALALKNYFETLSLRWRDKLSLLFNVLRLELTTRLHQPFFVQRSPEGTQEFSRLHSRVSDQQAIAFHYDVSNAFYSLWLDSERVYSCGYFNTIEDSIDQAQRNKLEHICRKLRLKQGERLLDIGCGWGALIFWAAQHHGVRAHGITISRRQFEFVQARIIAEHMQDRITVELCDYRDLPGTADFDKIASIGMFEHVGLANLSTYHNVVMRHLKPGGLFLNHGITHDEEGWNQTVASEFINRYVFPDGELDCVSNVQLNMERAGFEIQDVESLRRHYALTLRHWVTRLERNRDAALREVDEKTYRVWRLYMAACALEFESGGTGIYQILASRRGEASALPLTRSDLYVPVAPNLGASAHQAQTPLSR
jgi:cyclopropane-fatty-acyl-phospholipid synthase